MKFFLHRHSTLSFLLILAIALSAWSILISHPAKLDTGKRSNQPDAYMEDVVATIMNKEGNPSLKIESPKMTHFVDGDTTYIISPHVTVYRKSPQPWFINSDSAEATKGIEQIVFSNNVVIHHPSDIDDPNTTMETASLTIFPDKQQAKTDDAITITQPDTTMHAIGMLANLNDGTVQLLSQAKGDYVPSS